jgi:hypothetical protein
VRTAGYISPNQAAARLGIDRKTALVWANRALVGMESPFTGAQRTVTRRIQIPTAVVERLRLAFPLLKER